jgi:TolB-like protein
MEALGRLTGGVAHDFNNLLTVVLGNAAALRVHAEARGDTGTVQRAELIERAAERGGRLAGQLLAFSRRQILRPETVSVYRVISATHEFLAQAAGDSARVLLHAESGLWNCRVDPGQLESTILNLVLNARDAMPIGGNITISCRNARNRQSSAGKPDQVRGDYVRIDVGDHGTGIAPELREKVFEPFFTTKPIGQGSGLGLAQVHGFAGQSGGWVELESTVGRGTTISLFLPRSDGPASERLPKLDGIVRSGGNRTVMVVEPKPELRTATCEILEAAGYRAIGLADGSSAFSLLASNEKIDALLTEASLPGGVSGLALARSAHQVRPDLRIILASRRSDDFLNQMFLGSDKRFEYVMQPYRPPDVVRILAAVLTGNTFSTETEQLLAEAKNTASRAVPMDSIATGSTDVRKHGIRLGVMPFSSIGSIRDTAFSVGLAEELTTAFARFRWISCLSPASVAALIEEPPRTDRWRDLDLDFLVRGSFRRKGNEIRVVLRLINMRGSGEMTWGRRFDGLLPDVLNLQDQIASETAAQMAPELLVWEAMDARSRPLVDPDAYDMMLRAIPAIYRLDKEDFREAGDLLERSLALDTSSAACHSWLAHWYLLSLGQGWATNVTVATQRARELSERAVELDPKDARGLTVAGHIRAFLNRDPEGALGLHERAIALNPNLALAWCYSGLAHCYTGQHEEAMRRIEHAKHLSPLDPHVFFFDMALAFPLLLSGQYETAARVSRQASDRHPGLSSTTKLLLAALGHMGASREATPVRKALLALEPNFSVRAAATRSPLTRQGDLDCFLQGLRLAGIPEWSKARASQVDAIGNDLTKPVLASH